MISLAHKMPVIWVAKKSAALPIDEPLPADFQAAKFEPYVSTLPSFAESCDLPDLSAVPVDCLGCLAKLC